MTRERRTRVDVVVLGDIGRSPRMQYHALALADAGARVDLIGLGGSEPFAALREHPAIRIRQLPDPPPPLAAAGARYLAGAARRATAQARALQRALDTVAAPVILAQPPPAVPTLVVALRAARRRRARLVIDWHNLGHALLALRLGAGHPAVQLTALAEGRFGRAADAHLCVSAAMRAALHARWGIDAVVLPDRPARPFAPLADAARDDAARALAARHGWDGRGTRPALVIAPSGWSADDDFTLLLDALPRTDARLAARPDFPGLLLLLTGNGPRRDEVSARLAAVPLARIAPRAVWLAAEEYPAALAAADLGLCLHRSASGLDLPMKIADMFGAGLPVCALDDGGCLREMVRPDIDTRLFADAGQLADALVELLGAMPAATPALARLRTGALAAAAGARWDDAWRAHAAPLLLAERR
jgi:beta-1,4-mannosyltransferase